MKLKEKKNWCCYHTLVDLYIGIDLSDENACSDVTYRSAHYAQGSAEQCHVAEVKGRLEQTVHPAKKICFGI